jgi:hypothetical protein
MRFADVDIAAGGDVWKEDEGRVVVAVGHEYAVTDVVGGEIGAPVVAIGEVDATVRCGRLIQIIISQERTDLKIDNRQALSRCRL